MVKLVYLEVSEERNDVSRVSQYGPCALSAVLLVVLEAVHATGTPESSMHTLLTE